MISSKLALANASDATTLLHNGMLSFHGKFKSRSVPPTKLRLGTFKAPKFTPWDHMSLDSWLPDYAARHLSSLTNVDFGITVPKHAQQEQRHSGQGGAFVSLVRPQNDPFQHDRPSHRPGSSSILGEQSDESRDIFIEEGATPSFEVACPRCGNIKQGAGHWLYKPDRKCRLHCVACLRYPSARLWQ